MGDLQVWLPPQPNGVLSEESPSPSATASPSNNPHPSSIGAESWRLAEQTTREIICRIQPTEVSEQRRKAVVDYMQRLIRGFLGSEVFPFGSVPLKTYLPDGDIDLTALSYLSAEDALVNDVRSVLEGEEQNKAAEFEVKDVQYIHAEVKLVKCLVQNIVVDISFNQLGGLCALCFLEQVLYRFLDYFSKFDWDNCCVSLNGPVALSSLPEIVAETPETDGGDVLLSKEFLRNCADMFSVPSKGLESNVRSFSRKHLNIIDPLKESNNLGRSVSKGNFYRIRSAFSYGARKLGRILLLPGEGIVDELNKFFMNTLDRHGSGQRPDVQDPVPISRESIPFGVNGSGDRCLEEMPISASLYSDSHSTAEEGMADHHGLLCEEVDKVRISNPEKKPVTGRQVGRQLLDHQVSGNNLQRCDEVVHAPQLSGSDPSTEGNAIQVSRLAGDAKELATVQVLGSRITNKMHKPSYHNSESGTSLFGRVHHAPHLYFARPVLENGKIENGNQDRTKLINSSVPDVKASYRPRAPDEDISTVSWPEPDGSKFARNNTFPSRTNHRNPGVIASDSFHVSDVNVYALADPQSRSQSLVLNDSENFLEPSGRDMDSAGPSGSPEAMNGLADLSGDYDSHINSLLYGQWFYEFVLYSPVLPVPPTSPSQFRNRPSWDVLRRSAHLKRNIFPQMNANGIIAGPPFPSASGYYPMNPPLISGAYGVEEIPKPRGTGTYFPNTNYRHLKEKPLGRGRGPVSYTRARNNSRVVMSSEVSNLPEKGSQEPPLQVQPPQHPFFGGNGRGKPGPVDFVPAARQVPRGFPHPVSNGFTLPKERLEFGTFGSVQLGAIEQGRQLESGGLPQSGGLPHSQGSGPTLPSAITRSGLSVNQERATQTYHLKDDEDFPPLSV